MEALRCFDDTTNSRTTGGKQVGFSYSDGDVLKVEEATAVIGLVSLTY